MLEALERLAQGRTIFFIAHDLRLAARADLILYLDRGRVLEQGTHLELVQGDGRYATLYRQQCAPIDYVPGRLAVPLPVEMPN